MLFSRDLLTRAGGYGPIRPLLTDDVTLARAFAKVGGRCAISSELAYVRQERHSFREYWTRQVRWRMIARYFLPSLFWLAPLSWVHVYLAIGALALGSRPLALALAAVTLSRVVIGYAVQTLLDTAKPDRRKAIVLPVYDWIAVAASLTALGRSSVRWGLTVLHLDKNGAVVGTHLVNEAVHADLPSSAHALSQTGAR